MGVESDSRGLLHWGAFVDLTIVLKLVPALTSNAL